MFLCERRKSAEGRYEIGGIMTIGKAVVKRSKAPRIVSKLGTPDTLGKEAFRLVEENSGTIARDLQIGTANGAVLSTLLMAAFGRVGVDIEGALKKKPVITIAMRLGAERQFERDHPDVEKEQDSRQPELLAV